MLKDIIYSEDVIGGQEDLPLSKRKYKHPITKEPISYTNYMTYVEKGEAKHPEELFNIYVGYTQEVTDEKGVTTIYKFDKRINPNGPFSVEIIDPNGGEEWKKWEPENLEPIPNQEHLVMSKRKFYEPYTGDHISYSSYIRQVKEDNSLPTPQELYDKRLIRNPKKLRENQKDIPNSKQLYVINENGYPEYISYSSYMKLVTKKKYKHPDKI